MPLSSGMTRPIALAAPVLLGTMFTAAARARRRSPLRWGPSRTIWSPVKACTVVIMPLWMGAYLFRRQPWGQAVGGAGSGGDDLILSGQGLLVNAVNDGLQIVASGSGDDNLLGASVDVGLALRLGGVEAGALQNNVHADLAPGQILGVLLSIDLDGLAVDSDGILTGGDYRPGRSGLSGVVLQQMGQHSGAGQVVDRHDS